MSDDKETKEANSRVFGELYEIVKRLRDPDEGCPWDKKQTVESLKPFLLEEVYECFEAIDDNDSDHLKEELGDVYMLATMVAYIMEQRGGFSVGDVFEEVNAKLIRRHPHVFGDVQLSTSEEVIGQWAQIKNDVEGRNQVESVLDKVPKNLPPLERAYQLQQRAAEVGFDWHGVEDVLEKVREEIDEVEQAGSDPVKVEEEVGDLLFSLVNLSRRLKIDPSVALHRTNTKFKKRFSYVEREMNGRGMALGAETMQEMDELWNEAKSRE